MRRFWVEPKHFKDSKIEIIGDTFHHVIDVSRMQLGSKFEVLNQLGEAFLVELEVVNKKSAVARILERRQLPQLALPHLQLALSVPRPKNLDLIVEKSVELGVHSIHLFTSDYSFIRKPSDFTAERESRLKRIVLAACQQSARAQPLEIPSVQPLEYILKGMNRSESRQGLFAYEGPSDMGLKNYLQSIATPSLREIWYFVGSEGGFSEREVAMFQTQGLKPVSMGDQILRVETACVALTSVIKYALIA